MHVGRLLISALSVWALAWGAAPARAAGPFNIQKAATVYVTPRGMSVFQSELTPILERNGIDLSRGSQAKWEYESPEAVSLSRLPARFGPYAAALKFLRDELKNWLIGFSLRDPRFAVEVRDLGYSLQGLSFSLVPDFTRTQYLAACCGGGIAVRLEVTAPQLRIEAREALGRDLHNPFLGTFGVPRPWLEVSEPLRLSIPLAISVKPGGELSLKAMDISTNLAQVQIRSGYQSPLQLPKVQIQVNDRTMNLDPRPAETALVAKKGELIRIFQHHLADFVATELPLRLDGMAYDRLAEGFSIVKEIGPPGVDVFGMGDKFQWTLRLASLALTPEMLKMELEGSLVDPAVTWPASSARRQAPGPEPTLSLASSAYDVAFAVSFDVLNRIVALSYDRGALAQIPEDEAGTAKLKFLTAPRFSASHGGFAKLHLKLERETSGARETIGLKSPYAVDIDLDLKARVNPNGTFDFVILDIDQSTAAIDRKYVRFEALRRQVDQGLHDRLAELNAGFRKKERTVAELVEAPNDLFGLRMKLRQAEFDPRGYLTLYNDFNGLRPEPKTCFANDGASCRGDSK